MKRLVVMFASFVSVLPALVLAETIAVDVEAWAEVGTGETNGWTVSGIDRYNDGLPRFGTKDDFALSPEFADNVTQVVLRVKSSNATMTRFLTLIPAGVSSGARQQVAAASTSLTNETFSWTQDEAVRQFRLQNETGTGLAGWGVASLTVCTDRLGPPTGLREETLYRDAFVAGWTAAPKAVRYEVRFASVTRVPPRFKTAAAWDFSSLTNATGNSKDLESLKGEYPNVLDGVTGMNLGLQKYDGGHLQIGKDNVAGAMELQLDATASSRICFITNWRHDKDSSSGCSAFCLRGDGSTNEVIALTAGADSATDRFALPDGTCTLRVESPKSRRVEILSVIVAVDYVPESVTTNAFSSIGAKTTRRMLKGLSPGEWVWSARSFDATGRDSPWSPFRAVVLDADRPRRPRFGLGVMIR